MAVPDLPIDKLDVLRVRLFMSGTASDKWVPIQLHPRFSGGLGRVAGDCGWRVRRRSGGDEVCLEERYLQTQPQLLTPVKIGQASALDKVDYGRFDRWHPIGDHAALWAMATERARRVSASGEVAGFLEAFQLVALAAPDSEVVEYVKAAFENLARSLPQASLWVVEVSDRLKMRIAGASAIFGSKETPEVLDRAPFEGFPAARGLQRSLILGFEPLVEPVLAASAPYLHGVMSARAGGSIIMMFGEPIAGLQATRHPLELYRSSALFEAGLAGPERPDLPPQAIESALRWWVDRMNALLSVLLDPARYRGADGFFDPRPYFTASLNFERFFACLQTLLVYSHQDEFVRMSLLFDALDQLGGLGLGDYRETVRVPRVQRRLDSLQQTLPKDPATLFLPRCSSALDALKSATDGFFLHERRFGNEMNVKTNDDHWQRVPVETALADYLRIVRNAKHTFRDIARDERKVSLLAAHNGELPPALGDLPLIHALALLADPQLLHA